MYILLKYLFTSLLKKLKIGAVLAPNQLLYEYFIWLSYSYEKLILLLLDFIFVNLNLFITTLSAELCKFIENKKIKK